MLEPNERALYTDLLRPPPGYTFASAVATTYTLDLSTLLAVPLSLALFHGENRDEALRDPIAILEALRRTAKQIRVFCQRGRTYAPSTRHSLFPLLESVVREVVAPGGGAFHPKLWLLRFAPHDAAERPLLRLAVLSRNLTADRSWDLSLVLEGRPGGQPRAQNRPLADLLAYLHDAAEDAQFDLPGMIDDLRRTSWELPPGYDALRFHVLGLRRGPWLPERSDQLVVISPFVTDGALRRLAGTTREPVALISRPDELVQLTSDAWGLFGTTRVLAEQAETDDGEDEPEHAERLRGLHAKAYITKRGWDTHVYVGSANATDAALTQGQNVEVLAELVGKRSRVKSLDDLLGSDGFGSVLEPFRPPEEPLAQDPDTLAAERALESARRSLCSAGLRLSCEGEGDAWALTLRSERLVPLGGIATLRTWLVTQLADRSVDARPLERGEPVVLSLVPRAGVSAFAAFELVAAAKPVRARFVLNLPVEGKPEDRDAAVLRSVIQDSASFLRYLLLLLSGLREGAVPGMPMAGPAAGRQWGTGGGADDAPLIEDLTRALCRDPGRLHAIQRLISELADGDGHSVLPDGFMEMWQVFEDAVPDLE